MNQDPPITPFWKDLIVLIACMVIFFSLCYCLAWAGCELSGVSDGIERLDQQ